MTTSRSVLSSQSEAEDNDNEIESAIGSFFQNLEDVSANESLLSVTKQNESNVEDDAKESQVLREVILQQQFVTEYLKEFFPEEKSEPVLHKLRAVSRLAQSAEKN